MRSQLIAALLLVPALLLLAPQPAQAAAGAWLKNGGYTTVPGTNITLGPEVMNNFYDVEGAEDWVCGPHDQCFCYQWTHRCASLAGIGKRTLLPSVAAAGFAATPAPGLA